jgi:parallel beta-helix repeat protein
MLFRSLIPASLAVAPLPGLLAMPVIAQVVPQTSSLPVLAQGLSAQNYTVLHVNAVSGSDTSGDGSQFRPFQTISQALRVADRNSILSLAPGEYSAESGETFPLVMRSGVTIQGEVAAGTSRATILGNGTFATANGTYMQVTVVGADGAGLGNVTITNPNSSGYGLVVEQGRPVIRDNQFVGSGYAGVYVGGTAAPRLEQNLFSENGSVGVVLAEQSRAEVIGNTFENTGTGIQISPGAEPRVIQNRVVSNRQGIVMASTAQPQLQDNEIAGNRHNGLIEYTAAGKTEQSVRPITVNAPPPLRPARATPPGDATIPNPPSTSAAESPSLEPPPQPGPEPSLAIPPSDNRSTLTSPRLNTRPHALSLPLSGEDLGDTDDPEDSPEPEASGDRDDFDNSPEPEATTDSPVSTDLTQGDDSDNALAIESTSDLPVSTASANSGACRGILCNGRAASGDSSNRRTSS